MFWISIWISTRLDIKSVSNISINPSTISIYNIAPNIKQTIKLMVALLAPSPAPSWPAPSPADRALQGS